MVPVCFAAASTFSFSPRIRSVAASKSTSNGDVVVAADLVVVIVIPPVCSTAICGPVASYVSTDLANRAICDQAHAVLTGESLGATGSVQKLQGTRFVGRVRFSSVGVVMPRCLAHSVCVNETSVDLRHRAALGGREFGRRRDSIREFGMGVIIG